MSKILIDEAIVKLVLGALEFIPKSGSMLGSQAETKRLQAIAVMKEALVMQQLSEPCRCGKQTNAWCMANTCGKANEALDKMAENARELGLDYEPAQQEPVAWICYGAPGKRDIDFEEADINGLPIGTSLYTNPPQRTWQGLTDQEIEQGCKESWVTEQAWQSAVWWAEAKLRERNT